MRGKFIQNSNIYFKKIKGKLYILGKNKKYIHELNETAKYIWSLLKNPITYEDLTSQLTKKYQINKTQALKDTQKLIKHYLKLGFIKKVKTN